ncbi:MAG: hypothetical protein N2316_01160 [Spirochaetes bacterium]|nr:hypothetical protein [Spirochaetota bacterium]
MNQVPSAIAQIMITIIPIVGIVSGSIVIFFYLYYGYKAKILMIEKGIYRHPIEKFDIGSFSLFLGFLSFFVGLGLSIFFILKEGLSYGLLGGLIPLFVGIALIAFCIVHTKMSKRDG